MASPISSSNNNNVSPPGGQIDPIAQPSKEQLSRIQRAAKFALKTLVRFVLFSAAVAAGGVAVAFGGVTLVIGFLISGGAFAVAMGIHNWLMSKINNCFAAKAQ